MNHRSPPAPLTASLTTSEYLSLARTGLGRAVYEGRLDRDDADERLRSAMNAYLKEIGAPVNMWEEFITTVLWGVE